MYADDDARDRLGTTLIGARMVHHEQVDSTNLEALRLAGQQAPVGTVVTARTQTAGRGRLGRGWFDAPGRCLLLSALLEPLAGGAGLLTAAGALAVASAVRSLGAQAAIKWPNDVLIGGRKVAGVLAEGPREGLFALGIGVNVNGRPADLPGELRDSATFLSHELGREVDLRALQAEVLRGLDDAVARLLAGEGASLVEEIAGYDCLAGRRVRARAGERELTGEALGWADDGRLVVRDDGGRRVRLDAGEVTLI